MRVDSEGGRPNAAPLASPSPPPPRIGTLPPSPTAGAEPVRAPSVHDRVDRSNAESSRPDEGVFSLAAWAKEEWSTVAVAAHGMASVPGVVSKAWEDAAKTNAGFAQSIRTTIEHWGSETAAARQSAIDGLAQAAAPVSKTASNVARDLGQANRLPLAVEKSVEIAVRGLPEGTQLALKDIARTATSRMRELPTPIETRARDAAHALDVAATAQNAKASTTIGSLSARIGKTLGQAHGQLTGAADGGKILSKLPALADTPVVGVLLTGAAIVNDVHAGKSLANASIANVAGTLLGTAVGAAVTEGLASSIGAAAIADGTAASLGAAAAAGPVGWAVAGGVIASVGVGYGIYKAVESKGGQDIVDGAVQLDRAKIQRGLGEAQSDILGVAAKAGNWISANVAGAHR